MEVLGPLGRNFWIIMKCGLRALELSAWEFIVEEHLRDNHGRRGEVVGTGSVQTSR